MRGGRGVGVGVGVGRRGYGWVAAGRNWVAGVTASNTKNTTKGAARFVYRTNNRALTTHSTPHATQSAVHNASRTSSAAPGSGKRNSCSPSPLAASSAAFAALCGSLSSGARANSYGSLVRLLSPSLLAPTSEGRPRPRRRVGRSAPWVAHGAPRRVPAGRGHSAVRVREEEPPAGVSVPVSVSAVRWMDTTDPRRPWRASWVEWVW